MARTTRTLLAATTLVALLAGSLLAASPADAAPRRFPSGVVTAQSLKTRGMATSHSSSYGTYSKGTKVTIWCKTTGQSVHGNRTWYQIPSEGTLYVSGRYLKVTGSVPECAGDSTRSAKTAVKATIRTAPSTKDTAVRTVKAGTKLTVRCALQDKGVTWFQTNDRNWVLGKQLSGLGRNAAYEHPGACTIRSL